MAELHYFQSAGINTYINPLLQDGAVIHSLNLISFPYGAKSKRPGYTTFLNAPDSGTVQSLFAFPNINNDPTTINLYRASGSLLYYSLQGTANWAIAGNGTIANGNHFGHAIGNGGTAMIGGDGVGSTRHTLDGTSFINTTLAPIGDQWANYHGRAYTGGTQSTLFYSSSNDITNWNVSGTSDSSSLQIPGEGKNTKIFTAADRLYITKSKGKMFNWDDYQLIDMATNYGASSPYSVSETEDYRFWINQFGHFGFDGANAQILSNPVQRYFYNRQNTGIAGAQYSQIPAVSHYYDYLASIGSVTDDFTQRPINNAVLNYNYQKNEYLMWQFADNPTSYLSYFDLNNKRQMIFGNATGQCFQLDPSLTTDNGATIPTELVMLFTFSDQAAIYAKMWQWIRLYFNPGCEVNIQAAFADTFTYQHLQWFDITDPTANQNNSTSDGFVEFRFPQGSRSKLLFIRIYESSPNSAWTYYGCSIAATPQMIT